MNFKYKIQKLVTDLIRIFEEKLLGIKTLLLTDVHFRYRCIGECLKGSLKLENNCEQFLIYRVIIMQMND